MKKECCKCLYFYAGWDEENDCALSPDNVDFGDCRRYPPKRTGPLKSDIISITDFSFPLMWHDDWCGEFKQKKRLNIMIFSAKDAKLVWCPRALVVTDYAGVISVANRDFFGRPDPRCCCVANRCACWVWATTEDGEWRDEGFCGLANNFKV